MKTPAHLALLAAGAFSLALVATSAVAQDYGDEDTSYSDQDTNYSDNDAYSDEDAAVADNEEEIEVTAPRIPQTDARGMPQRVALSSDVPYGDLDLRTRAGARELRARIRYAAHEVCNELDARYPGPGGETQSCYHNALHNAMNEADDIIGDARGVAYNDEY